MTKIKESFIKCECGNRFNSPIFFGDVATFESATTSGNKAQCPACGVMIDCNKTNMSYVLVGAQGGVVGNDFGSGN
jgi:hypothetical protein